MLLAIDMMVLSFDMGLIASFVEDNYDINRRLF